MIRSLFFCASLDSLSVQVFVLSLECELETRISANTEKTGAIFCRTLRFDEGLQNSYRVVVVALY